MQTRVTGCAGALLALWALSCSSTPEDVAQVQEYGRPGPITPGTSAGNGSTPGGNPAAPGSNSAPGTAGNTEGGPNVSGVVPGAAPGSATPGTAAGEVPVPGALPPGEVPAQPTGPVPVARDLSCEGRNIAAADVISDFSTAEPIMYAVGTRGGTSWETFAATPASDPSSAGNNFQIDPNLSGPCNSGGSLHVSSPGNTDYGVGFGINFRTDASPGKTAPYDATADGYTGVSFWANCNAEVESTFLKFLDDATDVDVPVPQCSYDGVAPLTTLCRQYGIKNAVLLSGKWQRYDIYFGETLLDTDAVIAGTGLHANALTAFQIQLNSRANQQPNGFDCHIDDVHFLRTPTPRAAAPRAVTNINGHTIAPGGFYTEGNQIFDSQGNVHIFKGFARPTFEFDPAGQGVSRQDVELMGSYAGVNVVRWGVSEGYWLSNHPQFNRNYQAYIDRAVQWTLQSGMDVIIDLHWSGNPAAQQPMASRQSITFWQEVARKYAGDGRVIFELYNEPNGVSAQVWRNGDANFAGMQQMYDAVRAVGANNLVLVGGLDFAYDLDSLLPGMAITGTNIAYVTHPYRFKNPAPPAGYDAASAIVPIVATEFGDAAAGGIGRDSCDTATYSNSIADFTRRGMGWTAWAWVAAPERCAFPALLEKWDGTATPPGQVVFNALGGQN
jgi:endoglucanase